jgi:hypothetical protein
MADVAHDLVGRYNSSEKITGGRSAEIVTRHACETKPMGGRPDEGQLL